MYWDYSLPVNLSKENIKVSYSGKRKMVLNGSLEIQNEIVSNLKGACVWQIYINIDYIKVIIAIAFNTYLEFISITTEAQKVG